MKKYHLILLLALLGLAIAFPAGAARIQPATLSGCIVDEEQQPVAYATVVLLADGAQLAGQATDAEGRFRLKIVPGSYTLSVQFLGYESCEQAVQFTGDTDLGQIVLRTAARQIEGVVVTGQLIRREADRFVVDVANAPSAIGKDGIELLEFSPGVWIDDEKITINGKSGSVVYVNGRRLRMENDQLLAYLRSLRAEDIQKIEVVPLLGADHEASSSGGAIYLTLRKQRDNGTTGSLNFNTEHGHHEHNWYGGARINAHSGKFDYHFALGGQRNRQWITSDEATDYTGSDSQLTSRSRIESRLPWGSGSAGIIYEITPKHSVGLEFDHQRWGSTDTNESGSELYANDTQTATASQYKEHNIQRNYAANFNYIWAIDTLGSTFKVLADYTHRTRRDDNNRRTRTKGPGSMRRDSLYRDFSDNRYDIASATLALEKRFSPRWTFKAGAQYTYDRMDNLARYEYVHNSTWHPNKAQSYDIDYTEHIAAAYGILSANLGRWSFVAGLRGEYTHALGQRIGQDYGSLFPNANLSYQLKADGSYSLIGQYARTISRPGFWNLTPQRSVISDYIYQIGNPELRPTYRQDVNLTFVMKYKYSLTFGVAISSDLIEQIVRPDAANPDVLCLTWINWNRATNWYASANLPMQLTKWWQANVNLVYQYQAMCETASESLDYKHIFFGNIATTFTLPRKFYIDLSYRMQSRYDLGQTWIEPLCFLNAAIKKQCGDNWTLSFKVSNLFDRPQHVGTRGEEFVRRMTIQQAWTARSFAFSVSYKFKTGKAFRQKSLESETGEKSRL